MIKRIALLGLVAAVAATGTYVSNLPVVQDFKISIGQISEATQIDVKPRDLNLVCPGALNLSGGKGGNKLGVFSSLNTALLSSVQTPTAGTTFETVELGQSAASSLIPERISEPVSITAVNPEGAVKQGSSLLTAHQIQLASEASLAGLAGAQCQQPSHDIWLLNGDTSVGRESVLILTNASSVAATVDIQIFNQSGSVEAPGLSGFAVAAGKTQLVQLSSLIPRTKTFAVHISGRGGAVAAWIQQKTVRGLSATGVDYLSPSPGFSKTQFIPGVLVRGTKSAKKLIAQNADYSDLVPSIRVFVPGTKAAKVTVQILGSNAKSFGTVLQQDVVGGRVADLSVEGLADGDYVAIVSADVPIGASMNLARVDAAKNPVSDFALLTNAEPLANLRSIGVPTSGISKLSVVNGSKQPAEVTISAGPKTTKFTLPEAGSKVIEFAPGERVDLSATKPVAAALVVDLDGAFTVLPLVDYKNQKGKVAVSVR